MNAMVPGPNCRICISFPKGQANKTPWCQHCSTGIQIPSPSLTTTMAVSQHPFLNLCRSQQSGATLAVLQMPRHLSCAPTALSDLPSLRVRCWHCYRKRLPCLTSYSFWKFATLRSHPLECNVFEKHSMTRDEPGQDDDVTLRLSLTVNSSSCEGLRWWQARVS